MVPKFQSSLHSWSKDHYKCKEDQVEWSYVSCRCLWNKHVLVAWATGGLWKCTVYVFWSSNPKLDPRKCPTLDSSVSDCWYFYSNIKGQFPLRCIYQEHKSKINILHSPTQTQYMRPMYTGFLEERIGNPKQHACFRWKSVYQLGIVTVLHGEIGPNITRQWDLSPSPHIFR